MSHAALGSYVDFLCTDNSLWLWEQRRDAQQEDAGTDI